NLVDGRDAGAGTDHDEPLDRALFAGNRAETASVIRKLADWSLEVDKVPNGDRVERLRHASAFCLWRITVDLDENVQLALVCALRHGGVCTDDSLSRRRVPKSHHEMLAYGEANSLIGVLEVKGEDLAVRRDRRLGRKDRLGPRLILEEYLALCVRLRLLFTRGKCLAAGFVEGANVVFRHHLLCVFAELLRCILSGSAENGCCASWMAVEVAGSIIHFSIHYKPWRLLASVLAKLLYHNGALDTFLCHADFLDRLDRHSLLRFALDLFSPEAVGQVAAGLFDALHPATSHECRQCRVLKSQLMALLVNDYSEPGVVHHAENAPVHVSGLNHHAFVHATDHDVVGGSNLRHWDVQIPEAPAEARFSPGHVHTATVQHVTVGGKSVLVFRVANVGEGPRFSLVQRNLHTSDPATTSTVGVASDFIRLGAVDKGDPFVMGWVAGGAVGVEVVNGVTLVLPSVGQIGTGVGRDHCRKNAVVVDVIPVIAWLLGDDDFLQPLDAASANLSRDDDSYWPAVVRVEELAVHAVADSDAA
ncbi:hypothetical protein BN1708_007025, partial [Verticillium longisporum]